MIENLKKIDVRNVGPLSENFDVRVPEAAENQDP
jgi:hypothetical protein